MASPSNSEFESTYDIFLSFRGEDTRKKFTDHLYKALKHEGFHTFRDDDEIPKGKFITPELRKAIVNSRTSVIVLSKNYANSMACLFELQMILDRVKTSDHFVLPVFFEVDPQEIKKQAQNLDFVGKKVTDVEVKGWSAALTDVARMKGMVSQNQCDGWKGESLQESIKRHEHFLALQLGLKPGQKVLDVGCGIGGPLREIAQFRIWFVQLLEIWTWKVDLETLSGVLWAYFYVLWFHQT